MSRDCLLIICLESRTVSQREVGIQELSEGKGTDGEEPVPFGLVRTFDFSNGCITI